MYAMFSFRREIEREKMEDDSIRERERKHIYDDYYGTRNGRTVAKFLISRAHDELLLMSGRRIQ